MCELQRLNDFDSLGTVYVDDKFMWGDKTNKNESG